MRRTIDNIVTTILIILIVIICLGTIFFCLDVFHIIEVPKQFSIAQLFYSKIEVIATAQITKPEEIIPDNLTLTEEDIKEETEKEKNPPKGSEEETIETGNRNLQELINQLDERPEPPVEEPEKENPVNVEDDGIDKYYYNQLDEYGKKIYNKLYENKGKLYTGDYTADFNTDFDALLHQDNGEEILKNAFQLAINALTFDNPELFYIDVTKMYLLTETTTRAFSKTYRVSIGGNGASYLVDDFDEPGSAQAAITITDTYKKELVDQCRNLSTIQKIKLVHDYLVDTVEYDAEAGSNIYNIYGTLVKKRAVCEGYARSFKFVMDDLGIPCIIACGIAKNSVGNSESHAWNYVKVDGEWYAIDVTWDDPVIIGNGTITDEIRYTYFLRGGNKFYSDHYEDGNIVGEANFQYPKLSVLDYSF